MISNLTGPGERPWFRRSLFLKEAMLNLLAFAIMVGLGIHFDLSAGYYVLLTVGSLLGAFAGFA